MLYASAISAKRYALYRIVNGQPELVRVMDSAGSEDDGQAAETAERISDVEIVKRSEHGLGLYMNPQVRDALDDSDAHGGSWYAETWRYIIRKHVLGQEDVPEPDWLDLPAVSRLSVTTAAVLRAFGQFNEGKAITEQVTPSDFMLAVYPAKHVAVVYQLMRLVAPFGKDPSAYPHLRVTDIYGEPGNEYGITTDLDREVRGEMIPVKSYRDVLRDYVRHPEFKYDDAAGNPCGPDTRGALRPSHVIASSYQHITKDSSSITSSAEAFTHTGPRVYRDDADMGAYRTAVRVLKENRFTRKKLHTALHDMGIERSERQCGVYLSGKLVTPSADTATALAGLAAKLARKELISSGRGIPAYWTASQVLTMWRRKKQQAFQQQQRKQES